MRIRKKSEEIKLDFEINLSLSDKNNKEIIKDRLKNYINYANDVIKQYENIRKKFLDLSTLILTLLFSTLAIILNIYISLAEEINSLYLINLIIAFCVPIVFFFINIVFFGFHYRTKLDYKNSWNNMWYYRGNIKGLDNSSINNDFKDFIKKFENDELYFIKDDIKQLFILYLYQHFRYQLAVKLRVNFFRGIVCTIFIPIVFLYFICPAIIIILIIIYLSVSFIIGFAYSKKSKS